MANMFLISSRSRRSKNPKGKRSSSNSNSDNNFSCKKHKKHIQSPGICSLCLTEKLTKLSLQYNEYTKSYTNVAADETVSSYCSSSTNSSSTLVSSCYSSSSSVSSCSSPLQRRYRDKKDKKKQGFLFRLLLGSIVD